MSSFTRRGRTSLPSPGHAKPHVPQKRQPDLGFDAFGKRLAPPLLVLPPSPPACHEALPEVRRGEGGFIALGPRGSDPRAIYRQRQPTVDAPIVPTDLFHQALEPPLDQRKQGGRPSDQGIAQALIAGQRHLSQHAQGEVFGMLEGACEGASVRPNPEHCQNDELARGPSDIAVQGHFRENVLVDDPSQSPLQCLKRQILGCGVLLPDSIDSFTLLRHLSQTPFKLNRVQFGVRRSLAFSISPNSRQARFLPLENP